MARSRREKSTSVSSNTTPMTANQAVTINGAMAPPSSPPTRSSPVTRRKAPSVSKTNAFPTSSMTPTSIPPPKSAHAPAKPSIAKFVLVVLVSLATESGALNLASQTVDGGLAGISKQNPSLNQALGLVVWKITLLGVCWFGGFDAVDVASLFTLLQTPLFILLHFFYTISATTLLQTCTISILSPALPFYLLRPVSAPHRTSRTGTKNLHNRTIIIDPITTLATSVSAAIVYSANLQLMFSTFLPRFLIVYFTGLRDLTFAYHVSETLPSLFIWLAPAGIASTQFLFRPAEGASMNSKTATGANSVAITHGHFDPSTAGFLDHVYHNAWGWYSSRQKELIGRVIVLGALLAAETTVSTYGKVQGVELIGALGYAGVWVMGIAVLGAVLEWVGEPSD